MDFSVFVVVARGTWREREFGGGWRVMSTAHEDGAGHCTLRQRSLDETARTAFSSFKAAVRWIQKTTGEDGPPRGVPDVLEPNTWYAAETEDTALQLCVLSREVHVSAGSVLRLLKRAECAHEETCGDSEDSDA